MSNSPHWSINTPEKAGFYFFQAIDWREPLVYKLYVSEDLTHTNIVYCSDTFFDYPASDMKGYWWTEPISEPVGFMAPLYSAPPKGPNE